MKKKIIRKLKNSARAQSENNFIICTLRAIYRAVGKHLRKTVLILIFGLLTNILVSQEIQTEYAYKKEKIKQKSENGIKWNYVDSDSLVLYKNGTFHRTKFYHYHELIYSELKGNWKIENDTLILNIKLEKKSKSEKKWTEINSTIIYRIRKRKIKPINGYEFYAMKNLKLVKK